MKRFKKFLALGLAAFMLTGVLPSNTVSASEPVATTRGFGGDSGNGSDGDWTPVHVSGEYGTYVRGAESKSEDIFIRSVAKARSSSYYYNTSGVTAHTNKSGVFNPKDSSAYIEMPFYNYPDSSVPHPSAKTLSSGEAAIFYGTSDDPSKLNSWGHSEIYHDRETQPGKVIMTARASKEKILQGLIDAGASYSSLERGGNEYELYLSMISSVYEYNKWQPRYYTSVDDFKANAGAPLWEVVKDYYKTYFNIPFRMPMTTKNTVSYFDMTTGQRIYFKDIGDINLSQDGKNTLSSAYGPQLIPKTFTDQNGKKYELYVSQFLPNSELPETASNSVLQPKYINALNVDKTKPEDLYKTSRVFGPQSARLRLGTSWNSESMGTYNEKTMAVSRSVEEGIIWDNKNVNHYGSTIVAHYRPAGDGNIVSYDNSTGNPIKKANTAQDGSYTFSEIEQDEKGNMYELVQTSKRENTTVKDDIPKTKEDVMKGEGVTLPTDKYVTEDNKIKLEQGEIGRGEYKPLNSIPVLYYDDKTGDLVDRDSVSRSKDNKYTVKKNLTYMNKPYKLKQSSYKIDTDAEKDIASTGTPVMGPNDLNVSDTPTVSVSAEHATKDIVIRVSMVQDKGDGLDPESEGGIYTIGSQHLTQSFSYIFKNPLLAEINEVPDPEPYTHVYSCSGCQCPGHSGTDDKGKPTTTYCEGCVCPGDHECTVTQKYDWKQFKFDWSTAMSSILQPSEVFADQGCHTKISPLEGTGDWDVTVSPSLSFITPRLAVDGPIPKFAKYMSESNKEAIAFLKVHKMGDTVSESLIGEDYSDSGNSRSVSVAAMEGSKLTPHGKEFTLTINHSSCGTAEVVQKGVKSPDSFTTTPYPGLVVAEPVIKADELPAANKVSKFEVSEDNKKVTIMASPDALNFYPTFKMFAGGYSAWMLGAVERNFVPVDIYQVEVLNTDTPIKVSSTWSRDAMDKGKLVMKGGYSYGVSTKESVKIKVTSYIHVPKEEFVSNGKAIRTERLKAHEKFVNDISKPDNFGIYSNLPEAYQEDYPDVWKIKNPYRKSGDNVTKSRMKDPQNFSSSKGSTTSTPMTLEALDGLFGEVTSSAKRLKDQLQKKDWYEEKFEGFEVIKQETVISCSFGETVQTNFVRNGGTSYNDLAKKVMSIPANKFGITTGIHMKNYKLNGANVTFNLVTKPFLFDVRGMMYDDRN